MSLSRPFTLILALAAVGMLQAQDKKAKNATAETEAPATAVVTPTIESDKEIWIVTTETVPGKTCEAMQQLPVMALMIPTPPKGSKGMKGVVKGAVPGAGAIRGSGAERALRTATAGDVARTLRDVHAAAAAAGANAVVGLRLGPVQSGTFLYGTFARCE